MAAINDLIAQIENPELRVRMQSEVDRMNRQKRFGLVFEEHLPECVPLYGMPIKKGCKVALKTGKINEFYTVMQVEGDNVYCTDKKESQLINFLKQDIVCIAEFGEPIYPYLKQIDSIYNSDDTELPTHVLIQADNYHALQLLEYLYAEKVDCIYIDPPYNTGAKDWKYNNDYVDDNDVFRHSKWLSMMEKRLRLAKKLLNPVSGILIVAIDDNELNTLGLLLKEIFSSYRQFCITVVHNPNGNQGKNFGITNEFAYFLLPSGEQLLSLEDRTETPDIRPLRDVSGNNNMRTDAKNCFYPIYVQNGNIIGFGDVCRDDFHPESTNIERDDGIIEIYPIDASGNERKWVFARHTIEMIRHELHVEWNSSRKIFDVIRHKTNFTYKTVWDKKEYNANSYGSKLINKILCEKRFDYPKSLYTVKECIQAACGNRSNAIIVDFFAGSGTTMHAVNLLNTEDDGKRQCIMITNNEVSYDETKSLIKKGFSHDDVEWEKLGIANYVTWPRTKCSILGNDIKGTPIDGEYITNCKQTIEIDRKIIQIAMNGDSMSLEAKKSILSLQGKIPQNILNQNINYVLDEKYTIGILFNMASANEWLEALQEQSQIDEIYIVTDKKNIFNQLKSKIKKTLGKVIKEENIKLPISDGFKANAVFFKLGFLDKTSVQLGRQFKELVPLLWLKAGGWGKCPDIEELVKDTVLPPYIILPENRFAVLIDEKFFAEFEPKVNEQNDIWTAFIVTDFEKGFKSMSNELKLKKTYQLYRDYLDNFRINTERN